jgi:hypothetical protein
VDVVDTQGRVLATFRRGVFGDAALASLFGITGNLTPRADLNGRSDELARAIDEPKAHVAGASVSSRPRAAYAIEFLLRSDDRWAATHPHVADDQATISLAPGQVFAIRLINHSRHEAAVFLSIDGLSLFAFSENRSMSQVIVPAESSSVVHGWHRRGNEWEPFCAHRAGQSVAVRPHDADFQVVTAVFSVCWDGGDEVPSDEPPFARIHRYARCSGPTGTELGLPAEPSHEPAVAELPEFVSPDVL